VDTMINWFQVRGLGALAAIGLFLVYAVLAGWWQGRKAKGRANRAIEAKRSFPMDRSTSEVFNRRAA